MPRSRLGRDSDAIRMSIRCRLSHGRFGGSEATIGSPAHSADARLTRSGMGRVVGGTLRPNAVRVSPLLVGSERGAELGSVVLGCDLDEVAARVVEHGGRERPHVSRRLPEPHGPTDEALLLSRDVVDRERREGDAVLDERVLERAGFRMLVGFE